MTKEEREAHRLARSICKRLTIYVPQRGDTIPNFLYDAAVAWFLKRIKRSKKSKGK